MNKFINAPIGLEELVVEALIGEVSFDVFDWPRRISIEDEYEVDGVCYRVKAEAYAEAHADLYDDTPNEYSVTLSDAHTEAWVLDDNGDDAQRCELNDESLDGTYNA